MHPSAACLLTDLQAGSDCCVLGTRMGRKIGSGSFGDIYLGEPCGCASTRLRKSSARLCTVLC